MFALNYEVSIILFDLSV